MTLLVAFAGPSRSGKGTCASVFREEAEAAGLTSFERQLSDNGKWSMARIFRPTIRRVEAVAWFEELKNNAARVGLEYTKSTEPYVEHEIVPLQKFLQHGLQEGHRDIFGEDFWTDKILAHSDDMPTWWGTFFDAESGAKQTDVAIISDLRQPNEAKRVKDLHGIVIECARPDVEDQYKTGSDHIMERRLPPELVDYTIYNAGSFDEFKDDARDLWRNWIFPRLQEVDGAAR